MNILVNIGVKNYDDDENNDKSEDIKIGLLNDFNDLIFFGFSENPFKAPNLSFDRRFKTVFWFRTTVYSFEINTKKETYTKILQHSTTVGNMII